MGPSSRPTTAPVDPKVASAVRRLVPELDAPAYARRSAAADRLAQLGPPGLAALASMDRERLSPQQNLSLDLLVAASNPLPEEEARRLRGDVHFLLDCLYSPHESIRTAAADRLARVTDRGSKPFEDALGLDPKADPDRLAAAIERQRDLVAPPPAQK